MKCDRRWVSQEEFQSIILIEFDNVSFATKHR